MTFHMQRDGLRRFCWQWSRIEEPLPPFFYVPYKWSGLRTKRNHFLGRVHTKNWMTFCIADGIGSLCRERVDGLAIRLSSIRWVNGTRVSFRLHNNRMLLQVTMNTSLDLNEEAWLQMKNRLRQNLIVKRFGSTALSKYPWTFNYYSNLTYIVLIDFS